MEMNARAKSAKASDPIEDFILCFFIRWKRRPLILRRMKIK